MSQVEEKYIQILLSIESPQRIKHYTWHDIEMYLRDECDCIISLEVIQESTGENDNDLLCIVYLGHIMTIKIGEFRNPEEAVEDACRYVLDEQAEWIKENRKCRVVQ